VLAWVIGRLTGKAEAQASALGRHPSVDDAVFDGAGVDKSALESIFDVDVAAWSREAESISSYFEGFGDETPAQLIEQLQQLRSRLAASG
jgi:phosphoenolpyruvate carboxykinase (GTP)